VKCSDVYGLEICSDRKQFSTKVVSLKKKFAIIYFKLVTTGCLKKTPGKKFAQSTEAKKSKNRGPSDFLFEAC
jgi:hypothetical protein